MSQDRLPSDGPRGSSVQPEPIRFVLTPYRSLSRPGFLVLMGFIGAVSFVAGIAFAMMGAWPVLGFFGLDVALLWYAFQRNYRSGRQLETIEISDGVLTLTHVDVRGARRQAEFTAAWVDVRLRRAKDGRTAIALASHGREHAFGGFLTDEERLELAPALREAVLAANGGLRI